jgi:hypothetical protein
MDEHLQLGYRMLTSVYLQFGRWFVILWAAEKGGDGTEKAWEWERRECQRKGWMPEKGGVSVKGGDSTEEGKSTEGGQYVVIRNLHTYNHIWKIVINWEQII